LSEWRRSSERVLTSQAVNDPRVVRFLGALVLGLAFFLLGLESYLGRLQLGTHFFAMALIGIVVVVMLVSILPIRLMRR
jgi:hypothetical protein